MHGRDECIVLLTILVIHEGLATSREDTLSRELSLSLEDTCCFEEIHRTAEVSATQMREYLPWMSYTTCSTLICRDDDTRISLVYLVSIFLEKCDDIRLRDRLEDIGATA